jgi:hypothetical protein
MKRIILFVLTPFFCFISFGQIRLGVKGGLNIANAKNLTASPQERYSFHAGFNLQQTINKKMFFQPELLYSSKGHSFTSDFASSDGANRLDYLSIPVLFGYRVDDRLSILLGPEFNYLLKSAVRYDRAVSNFTKQYPRFDAGIDLGLAYRINKKLGAELRYYYGFNTLYYTDFAGVKHDEVKGANRTFQAGVTYWFR